MNGRCQNCGEWDIDDTHDCTPRSHAMSENLQAEKWKLDNHIAQIRRTLNPIQSQWATYHNSFAEAKAALVARTEAEVDQCKAELAKAIKLLKKVRKMEQPHGN